MNIESMLQGIRAVQASEKTAAEKPAPKPAQTKTAGATSSPALLTALNEALGTETSTNTAAVIPSAPSAGPVAEVMKVAAEIAASEKEAALKEAALLGAAFADAAVARLGGWQQAAEKLASQAPTHQQPPASFAKFAAENPQVIAEAAQAGYAQTRAGLEKQAEDEYVRGYNEAVVAIHKTAQQEFLKAAAVTQRVLKKAQARQ